MVVYLVVKDAADMQFNKALVTLVRNKLDLFRAERLWRYKLRASLSCA